MESIYSKIWAITDEAFSTIEHIFNNHIRRKENPNFELEGKFDCYERRALKYYSVENDEKGEPQSFSIHNALSDAKASEKQQSVVAVIPVVGPLFKGANLMTQFSGATSMEMIGVHLRELANDNGIKSVILKFDTPGGTADGMEMLQNEIRNFPKPIWAYVDGLCASAGYGLASQCDRIVAGGRMALIGSIGTMFTHTYINTEEQYGEKVTIVRAERSFNKNKANPYEKLSKEGLQSIMSLINPMNDVFLNSVTSKRKIKDEEDTLSGKMFDATEAQNRGLVDDISTLDWTIQQASKGEKGLKEKIQNTQITDMKKTKYPFINKVLNLSDEEQKSEVDETKKADETTGEKVDTSKSEEKAEENKEEKATENADQKAEEAAEKSEEKAEEKSDSAENLSDEQLGEINSKLSELEAKATIAENNLVVKNAEIARLTKELSLKDEVIKSYEETNSKLTDIINNKTVVNSERVIEEKTTKQTQKPQGPVTLESVMERASKISLNGEKSEEE